MNVALLFRPFPLDGARCSQPLGFHGRINVDLPHRPVAGAGFRSPWGQTCRSQELLSGTFIDFVWLCSSTSAGGLWSVFTLGGAASKAGLEEEREPLPLSNQSLLLLLVLANLTDGPDWPNPYRQAIACFRNTQGECETVSIGREVVRRR